MPPVRAYIDDSGTHTNDSPVCVAAGYFGGAHYWKQFDLDWERAVKSRGLDEFHGNRFWSRAPALRFTRKNPVPGQDLEDGTPLARATKKARDAGDFKLFNKTAFDLLLAEFRKDVTCGAKENGH
jgi:hypothetical protein